MCEISENVHGNTYNLTYINTLYTIIYHGRYAQAFILLYNNVIFIM